ncbi:PilZ domain-containing protein [Sporolactobacillus kofuensis]|uniref:PilZ domain-containing protein n=1 Tax=Sporolactobacillus kofuensis TaxID=269672 RepID=A0ABW1WJC3_9BACL|nr:PilZ domain-containing protein [Sporolactobacillus kofuensis]MCO7176439.1 PilZ domain-containing protein [Sporolactobacillus kofuensis]
MSRYTILALGAGIEMLFVLIVLSLFILHYRRIMYKDRITIMRLKKKLSSNQKLIADKEPIERRKHHRIKLSGEKCTIRVIDFGEHTLQKLNNKSFDVEMLDLSVGGMKIKCTIDFPVKKEVYFALSFAKEDGTMIHVKGMVTRKEVKHGRRTIN